VVIKEVAVAYSGGGVSFNRQVIRMVDRRQGTTRYTRDCIVAVVNPIDVNDTGSRGIVFYYSVIVVVKGQVLEGDTEAITL
jgi:hypothetical protein